MEKKSVKIRSMKFENLRDVFILGEKVFSAQKYLSLYRTWDEYEVLERFISDGEYCFVAVDEENHKKVIGFCLGTIIAKKKNPWIYGYLIWIGVEPGCKKKGVGKKLIRKITRTFKENGARLMFVDTASENEEAIRFFKRNKFEEENTHIFLSKNIS